MISRVNGKQFNMNVPIPSKPYACIVFRALTVKALILASLLARVLKTVDVGCTSDDFSTRSQLERKGFPYWIIERPSTYGQEDLQGGVTAF